MLKCCAGIRSAFLAWPMCAAIVFWGTGVFRASAAASRKPSCHHLSGQAFQALTGKSLKNIIILISIYRNAQMQAHLVEHEWTAKKIYSINPLPPSQLGLGQVTLRDRTVGGLACLGGLGGRPSTSRCAVIRCDQWVWQAAAIRSWPGEEWEEVEPLPPLPLPNFRNVSWRTKIGENWKTG